MRATYSFLMESSSSNDKCSMCFACHYGVAPVMLLLTCFLLLHFPTLQFLKSLLNFDKDNIPTNCVDQVEKDFLSNPNFTSEFIKSKSSAAAGLCAWVINICKYFRIYQVVAPKRAALAEANKKLEGANKKLTGIRAKVKELNDRVAALEESLMKATEDKNAAIAQAEKTQRKAGLADRLVNGLSGENKRWSETIAKMGVAETKLVS